METRPIKGAAGPGAQQEVGIAPKPLLEGASAFEYVVIYNPLDDDFYGQVATERDVNIPIRVSNDGSGGQISLDETDVRRNYGLNLKNQDHRGKERGIQRICIPAKGTTPLYGNEAQVVVRQLVNEILQREGNSLLLADPFQRHRVENIVIRSRSSIDSLMAGGAPVSVQSQRDEVLTKVASTLPATTEDEFPELEKKLARPTPIKLDKRLDNGPKKLKK